MYKFIAALVAATAFFCWLAFAGYIDWSTALGAIVAGSVAATRVDWKKMKDWKKTNDAQGS